MLGPHLRSLFLAAIVAAGIAYPTAWAQAQGTDSAPVFLGFGPGAAAQEVRGVVTGYQQATYAFEASPGQEFEVRLAHPGRASLYHNLVTPSGKTVFVGSMDGPRFQGVLREGGRYEIRVYLMRNDARRGIRAPFTLRLRQLGSGPGAQPPVGAQPSFNCRRASGPVETAICRNPVLANLDGRLDFVYRDALASAGPGRADQIRRNQRNWMQDRGMCIRERDLPRCLQRRYESRIAELAPKR